MIRSIQGAAIVPGRLGYSQVAHHRAFESPSRESHRSPSKGRRLHACAPRFFLSDLNTTDTFLDNPFSRPPVVGNGIEKASRKSPARRAVVDHIHPRERNAILCCQVWDFFFSDFSRVPSSWTFWSLARPSWKRKMTLRQWGGLMFNRKHTSRQKPPKLPSHCLARWKDVREVCVLHRRHLRIYIGMKHFLLLFLTRRLCSRLYPLFRTSDGGIGAARGAAWILHRRK